MTNAEKFKTAEERYAAFNEFCFAHNCGMHNDRKPKCPLCKNESADGANCKFYWLELEYLPKLKPCPFCNGKDICLSRGSHTNGVYVVCANCGCRTDECSSESSAVERWNRRVDS